MGLARIAALFALPSLASASVASTVIGAQSGECGDGGAAVPERWVRFANTSIDIAAPPATVWELLAKGEGWKNWNDVFFSSLDGEPQVGKRFWVKSHMESAPLLLRNTRVLMEFSVVNTQEKLCWQPQMMPVTGNHCYILCPTATGTRVYNFEDQRGVLQPIIKRTMGQATTNAFNRFNEQLSAESVRRV